jgi:pilus assembly protein Flp/PilA
LQAFPEQAEKAKMKRYIKNFWNDTQGQDLVEYALAAGMVAVAAVAAMPQLSTVVNTVFTKIGSIITSAVS